MGPHPPIAALFPSTPLIKIDDRAVAELSMNRKSSFLVETDIAEQVSMPTTFRDWRGSKLDTKQDDPSWSQLPSLFLSLMFSVVGEDQSRSFREASGTLSSLHTSPREGIGIRQIKIGFAVTKVVQEIDLLI
jgi:hypothetical protein